MGAGFGLAVSIRERKERGRRLGKKMVLTGGWAPPVSHQPERGKGGGGGWAAAQEGDGARGVGLLGYKAEKRKGERGKGFLFLYTISK